MANAQILMLVMDDAVAAENLRALVATAAGQVGFTPGPWTAAAGSSRAVRDSGSTRGGTFSEGPWLGLTFTSNNPLPDVPFSLPWSAIRMNVLNGPADSEALVSMTERIRAGLSTLPSNVIAIIASRGPRNAISWDRGVPAPIPLAESSGAGAGGGGGFLLGLGAIAALAWWARSA
jgi:hypothetical protein